MQVVIFVSSLGLLSMIGCIFFSVQVRLGRQKKVETAAKYTQTPFSFTSPLAKTEQSEHISGDMEIPKEASDLHETLLLASSKDQSEVADVAEADDTLKRAKIAGWKRAEPLSPEVLMTWSEEDSESESSVVQSPKGADPAKALGAFASPDLNPVQVAAGQNSTLSEPREDTVTILSSQHAQIVIHTAPEPVTHSEDAYLGSYRAQNANNVLVQNTEQSHAAKRLRSSSFNMPKSQIAALSKGTKGRAGSRKKSL